jgi:hypothetical protein
MADIPDLAGPLIPSGPMKGRSLAAEGLRIGRLLPFAVDDGSGTIVPDIMVATR